MKLKIIILTITTICVLLSCKETKPIAIKQTQDNNTELDSKSFDITDRNPEFPGGDNELLNYISNNLKYPESAKANGISGRVPILLTINEKGEITDAKVISPFSLIVSRMGTLPDMPFALADSGYFKLFEI